MAAKLPDDDEWETVKEAAPTKVEFDEFGDKFVGVYLSREEITDPNTAKTWTQHIFTGIYPDELAGERCGINGLYDLDNALAEVPFGSQVQITYVKDVPTHKGNPLKSFDIRQRKGNQTRVTGS